MRQMAIREDLHPILADNSWDKSVQVANNVLHSERSRFTTTALTSRMSVGP